MSSSLRFPRPGHVWLLIFALWALFLSGALAKVAGTPGIVQALRLKGLLETKQARLGEIQQEISQLQLQATRLEHSTLTQQREIRRVLGYAAPDELIFDFANGDRI